MCDSDNKKSITIRHALKALDKGKGQVGYKYFEAHRWLDLTKKVRMESAAYGDSPYHRGSMVVCGLDDGNRVVNEWFC